MSNAIICIRRDSHAALRGAARGIAASVRTGRPGGTRFTFATAEQLFRAISPKRWEVIECLQGLGPSSVRGLARALARDVKRVHADVSSLIELGLVERTDTDGVHVSFDTVHIDFDLRAAA